MVRETRHLWVGNLPDNVREERIREHFQRYGRVQSVKLLPRTATSGGGGKDGEEGNNSNHSGSGTGYCAAVAFMDIKSAAKAHASENSLDDRCLVTDYYEPLLQDQSRTSTPTGSSSGGVNSASTATPSSSRSHLNNSVGGGGYDRSSSHYFERRGDPHLSDGSGFLRRQAPVNHHGGYNNHRGSYRSSNGPPFSRDPERGGSSSYRVGPPYSTYGDPPGSGSRYQPPPDYSTVQDERVDFVSGSSGAVGGGTPNSGKRNNSSNSSSVIGPLPGNNLAATPLSTRKRKSSRSPSRSRSGSADSRTPPSSRSRSRSRSQSPTSSASVPSGRGGGSRCSTRSTSPGYSPNGGRTLSPTERGIRADGDDSRSSSRSSNNSSPHSQASRTGKKTPHSAQSSSPRSSRSSQGSSRSPGWLSTSATHGRRRHHHHGHRSPRHRLSCVGSNPVTSSTSSCHIVNNSSSPSGQMCHLVSAINSNGGGEMRRPLAICVRNLPLRSSDTSLKDGLFHEYKKHGKVVTVKVAGQGSDRVAIVRFKKAEDVEKALEVSRDKLFFGCKIEVTPWDSGLDLDDNEFRPLEADLDEYHPKATRTLFIGNLEKDVTSADLRAHFETFGPIIEIDIKKQSQGSSSISSLTTPSGGSISSSSNNNNSGNNNAYAFCQYADIASVVRAMRHLDGEQVGNTRVKLGFGKSMPTNCVWLHGIADTVAEKFLARHMSRFGHVSYAAVDRERCNGLVFYDQVSCAQAAVQELRGRALAGRKLQVDFASRECQAHFFELVEREPSRSGGSSSSAAAAAVAASASIQQHRLTSLTPSSASAPSSGRIVRTPSCSSRSSTHSKERTGSSSSSRSRHGGTLSRDESLERDTDMKDLTLERDSTEYHHRRCASSRSPSPVEKDITIVKDRYLRRTSIEPVETVGSPLVERERTRRYGSGGSSSSSGLSMDTGLSGPPPLIPSTNGSDVFSRIRDLSEEERGEEALSSGEEDEEGAISDLDGNNSSSRKSTSSSTKKAHHHKKAHKKKKSKLSGSSDSGVSDVSTNEPLPTTHPLQSMSTSSAHLIFSSLSVTTPSSTPTREVGKNSNSGGVSASNVGRPSRRVSRLSTDSSGEGASSTKHSLPRIIPWEVETPQVRKNKSTATPDGGNGSRPGTPLCDESGNTFTDELPTDPRSRDRPGRSTERPMSLPLPRFALELSLSNASRTVNSNPLSKSISSTVVTPSSSSTDGTFRIPHPHGTSVSPSRASAATAVPGSPRGAPPDLSLPSHPHLMDSSSDSECSSGSSPQRTSLSTAAVSLAEQLRQWEQRYEQWSTRSNLPASVCEGLPVPPGAVASPTLLTTGTTIASAFTPSVSSISGERYRIVRKPRPMSLDELKSQEPSDIVRCLLAKHSVFDEDLKRLESSGRESSCSNTATPTTPSAVAYPPATSSLTTAVSNNKESIINKSSLTVSHPVVNHVSVPPSTLNQQTVASFNSSKVITTQIASSAKEVSSKTSSSVVLTNSSTQLLQANSPKPKTPPRPSSPLSSPTPTDPEEVSARPPSPSSPTPAPLPLELGKVSVDSVKHKEEKPLKNSQLESLETDGSASLEAAEDDDQEGNLVIVAEEEENGNMADISVSTTNEEEGTVALLPSVLSEEERNEVAVGPPSLLPPPPVLPTGPPPLMVAVTSVAEEREIHPRYQVEPEVVPVSVETAAVVTSAATPVIETSQTSSSVKPPRVKHNESHSLFSSSKSSSRDSKFGERSRHTSSSSSSHRKDKSSSVKHHTDREAKDSKTDNSLEATSNHQLVRRKSRESGEQQSSGSNEGSQNNGKRRRSIDASTSVPSSSKRSKSEKSSDVREKDKEKDKIKTHDKENKETPSSATPKLPKLESKRESSSTTTTTSSKSVTHSSSPASSLSSSKKKDSESSIKLSKSHREEDCGTRSKTSSSKSSSSKSNSSKKEKDKDRSEKERTKEKEKKRDEERELERRKRNEEERPEKKKDEVESQKFKEHKDKTKNQHSPASATGSSATQRRRSDGDRGKPTQSNKAPPEPSQPPVRKSTSSQSQRSSTSSRKKSQSDSDSSYSSQQSETERRPSLSIRGGGLGGSKASSDEDDSDSGGSNDGSDYSPSKADRSLAAFLENEPTYFSMYDKVKARSLKLQQQKRQEEEKKSLQQQQQDKFCALRQARIAAGVSSKRDKDGKKINAWDSSDSSDSDGPICPNRPRPMATASILSSTSGKLSSSSSSSSSEDSEPTHQHHSSRSNKSKDFLFDYPTESKHQPSKSTSKSSGLHSTSGLKSKPIISSSDSESEPEVKPSITNKNKSKETSSAASVSKRRPSAPEINHKFVVTEVSSGSKKTVERSHSTVLHSKKSKKDSSGKLLHHSPSCGAPTKLSSRGEEKMETIFGPLSDDSDDQQNIKSRQSSKQEASSSRLQVAMIYSSDSDAPVLATANHVKTSKLDSCPPYSPSLDNSSIKTEQRLDKRKKKSKESRSRDRKKSGSKEAVSETVSSTPAGSNHHHRSSKTSEEILEASRALESKLMEDSLIAIANLAVQKEKEKEAELQRSSVSVEHVKSKKKKKKSKTHRDAESHHQSVVASVKTESSSPLPPATSLHIKTEPADIFSAAPAASSSPRVHSTKTDRIDVEPKLMSMPSLWEPPATSVIPSLPPPLISVDQPKPVQKVVAPRPAIWKQETEDAVAGLLLETFDDFKMETLDQVDEPVEVIPQGLLRSDDELPSPPEGEEQSSPQPNEEALKAIQSLQCEDDLDLSGEMIIDSEAGTSSTEDTPAPADGPLYSGSSSSDAVEMAVRLNSSSGSVCEKPGVVETAPTPPPSPPELCIDETRCTHPVDGNDSNSQSPPKEGGIVLNRTPRTDVDLSKSPRTPRTPDVRSATPDLPPFAHPNLKTEMMAVQQHSSPVKRGRKPNPLASSNRSGRGRGRGRPPGSSRGVSESSVEGHDADVYEFNDMEEEGTVVTAVTTAIASAPVTTTVITVAHATVPTTVNSPDTDNLQHKTQLSEPEKVTHLEGNFEAQRKDLEGLKGRLMFDPRTTIDDTIEHVVRGVAQHHGAAAAIASHHHMMVMAGVASPSSPRGTVRAPPVTPASVLTHPQQQNQRTTSEPFTTTTGPAVMKVELPQPLLKEQQQPGGNSATSVEPIPSHINPARRPCYDEPSVIPNSSTHAVGLPIRRPEEVTIPLSSSPSTVVLNLRSGSGHQPQGPLAAPQAKVPSPKLAVITTSTSGQSHPLLSSSSSVTITPTAPVAGPPPSTVIHTQQQQQSATGTSAEVARLPSATVVTPVPAKTPASGPSYPAVPLTRDAPPHGLLLQQQQHQQQHPHQQTQQKQLQSTQTATSAQQQQVQSQQQHSSHPPQLPLPAGVPVSLSGGATVIAVASNGRVSGPPPLVGRQTVVSVPHSMNQNQPTMASSTVVIARSVGPPQQQSTAVPTSRGMQQHPTTSPSPLQTQHQRPPPAIVTLYSTGGYSQQQPTSGIASVASTRPPVSTASGSSVSVLPATSRPPLSASNSSSSGGVSVYPIYGPRAELTPVAPSSAAALPFGSPLTSTPVRVTVSNSASSTVGRATISQTPVVTAPASGTISYSRQPAYPTNETPAHHYAAAYHHLGQQQQHSPNVAPAEPPRQQSNTPVRDDLDRGVGPSGMTAHHHTHLLPRELPTPPPAHQHSPVQQPADLSRVVTPSQMMQHHQHQQLMYQQFIRAQQELARMGGSPYSPAPPQHGQEALGERDKVAIQSGASAPPSSIPLHLRNLAAGGEHRTTESPLQASAAVPFSSVGGNQQAQQHYNHHRPGSGSAVYPTSAAGHVLAPPSPSSHHRTYAPEELTSYHPSPPPAHLGGVGPGRVNPTPGCEAPSNSATLVRPPAIRTPPHASQAPPQSDSLVMLLQRFPIMWQGLMALKNDHAVVQMHFISGNPLVARGSLPCTPEGHALPLRIAQRMRLEQQQLEGVARKVQMEQEHCILLALPCGRDAMDVLLQSNNLRQGFITYLQLKQAAGIVNVVTGPQGYSDVSSQPSYVVHIFPACEFANDTLARITPDLLHRVTDIAHLLVVIATV